MLQLLTNRDLVDLKNEKFSAPIAEGQLSTGQRVELFISRKAAPQSGLHLVLVYVGRESVTELERQEGYTLAHQFASTVPLAQQFGYRFEENIGKMKTRPEEHSHIIIPGERDLPPRIVDPWPVAPK